MATFTAYIQMILSAGTVYRVVWDTKNCGISSNYIYSIDEKIFNNYIGEQAVVDKLVNDNPPRNKDESLTLELYEIFKNGKPDVWGHKGITSPTPLVLHL